MPAVQKLLDRYQPDCMDYHPSVADAFGLERDGFSVALIDECASGTYTDTLVALRLEHGRPVLAEFRGQHGKPVENGFSSGASAMHSVDAVLDSQKKAVIVTSVENDQDGRSADCSVKAYVWNARSRAFNLDTRLSKSGPSR